MTPDHKPKNSRGGNGTPTFMRKSELARELGVDRKTVDRLIADGQLPPPHSRYGPRIALWLRKHFEFYVQHRYWPKEAFPHDLG